MRTVTDPRETLRNAHGMDPFSDASSAEGLEMPSAGWLLAAQILPGIRGSIEVYRYLEGSLGICRDESLRDDIEGYPVVTLNGCGLYSVAYEDPYCRYKSTEPCDRIEWYDCLALRFADTDITPLGNGGRLLGQSAPMILEGRTRQVFSGGFRRAVAGVEELGIVLMQVGAGMNLEENDIRALVTAVGQKVGHLD